VIESAHNITGSGFSNKPSGTPFGVVVDALSRRFCAVDHFFAVDALRAQKYVWLSYSRVGFKMRG
jgi:hypothetical protein